MTEPTKDPTRKTVWCVKMEMPDVDFFPARLHANRDAAAKEVAQGEEIFPILRGKLKIFRVEITEV